MKKNKTTLFVLLMVALGSLGLQSCKKNSNGDFDQSSKADLSRRAPIHLSGLISSNTRLTKNNTYYLDGIVYVTGNSELYIEGGTHIVTGNTVAYGSRNIAGVLVVTKGSKILADGNRAGAAVGNYNADSTIVFSPDYDTTPNPVPGSFGGIIVLGDAPTNQPTTTVIEGIPTAPPADITYGGTDVTDNSGVIRNVRIEYPGFQLATDNEINGLTLGGVGNGTTLSHIQVAYSDDDSFEFFGGTVNADHLVAVGGIDDDFDFDFGYTGTIQFALSLKNPEGNHTVSGGVSDANGIESDNNPTGVTTPAGSPITKPVLRNFTLLGYRDTTSTGGNPRELENGVHFRRASALDLQNSIIAGYRNAIRFENITTASSVFRNNVAHAFVTTLTTTGNPATYTQIAGDTGVGFVTNANSFLNLANVNAFYIGSVTYAALNLRPNSASPLSPAATGGNTAITGGTTYRGAIDPAATASTIWTRNWTVFNP